MKLVFLGTAADSVGVALGRSSGGLLIDSNDTHIHIDPGPGTIFQSRQFGINIRETTAIIVTSPDLYASHDLHPLIDAMTYSGVDRLGVVVLPKALAEGAQQLLLKPYADMVERIIPVVSDQRIGINDVEIKIIPTTRTNCIGIKFDLPDGIITYTGDTEYSPELLACYQLSRVIIMNVAHLDKKENHGLCVDDVKKILLSVKPKLAILSKIGGDILKNDPLFVARKLQLETGVPVLIAKEGLTVTPAMYGVEGQKTLRTFK